RRGRGRGRCGGGISATRRETTAAAETVATRRFDAERRTVLQTIDAFQTRQLVGVNRLHQIRGDDEHQLGLLLLEGRRFEQVAEDRHVANQRNLRQRTSFVV